MLCYSDLEDVLCYVTVIWRMCCVMLQLSGGCVVLCYSDLEDVLCYVTVVWKMCCVMLQ